MTAAHRVIRFLATLSASNCYWNIFNNLRQTGSILVVFMATTVFFLAGCPSPPLGEGEGEGDGEGDGEEAGIWYVKQGGTGTTGDSWVSAFGDIQSAVDAASTNGGGEVWVAKGTYTTAVKSGLDSMLHTLKVADSTYVLTMAPNVHLYGGFAEIESNRVQRNWVNNQTIIDGDGARTCVRGANEATLDGFIIQNGHAMAGGGLFDDSASPLISHCTFSGNTISSEYGSGGGMHNTNFSSPTVKDCIFSGNTCTGEEVCGGGMINENHSSPMIDNCTFIGNDAFIGAGMFNENNSAPTITNCLFTGNTASHGAGIYNHNNSSPTLNNCTFINNTAIGTVYDEGVGGGMANNSSSPILNNCIFSKNSAYYGGGIWDIGYASPTVINCTITLNSGSYGSGIFNEYYCSPTINNCILWDNTSQQLSDCCDSTSLVTYSCVEGGYEGTGNIPDDPLFADAANGDVRLQDGSPCIDTGTAESAPDTDIEGTARPQGAGFDMGAYEK